MYTFGIAVMLGLAVFAVAMFADRYLSLAQEYWAVVLVGLGVGVAWLVDFNLWREWGMEARRPWIGVTLTGLMLGGLGLGFRGVAHLLSSFTRKVADEAESIEKEKNLRRVA
jgi:drug/metabolite transporter (DMT)-like permease